MSYTYDERLIKQFTAMRPAGGYGLIKADPPWKFKVRSEKTGITKSPQAKYKCMTLDEIKAMPVSILAADDAVLWLWATHPMLDKAFEVMDAWGFKFKTSGVWSKRNPATGKLAFGTGYLLRCASEPFLIGTRGKPKTAKNIRTVVEGARREHSRKPEESFDAAERMMPNAQRLEMFSREARPGWTVWGDQFDKFNEG